MAEKTTEKDICDVARKVKLTKDQLSHLFLELEISRDEIENAKWKADTKDFKLQAVEVLNFWRSSKGKHATKKTLLKALSECGCTDAKETLEEKWNMSSVAEGDEKQADVQWQQMMPLRSSRPDIANMRTLEDFGYAFKEVATSHLQPAKHTATVTRQNTFTVPPVPAYFKTSNGINIVIDNGDITQAQVDIIVNAANKRLQHGHGVARAVSIAAGRKLQQACNLIMSRRPPLRTGDCAVTDGYNLKCRILHTVWPIYKDYSSDNEFYHALKDTFMTAMRHANLPVEGKSVAIPLTGPLMSSGVFDGPKEICADALLEAVEEFNLERYLVIKTIVLINQDKEATQAIYKAFAQRYSASKATSHLQPANIPP